MDWNVIKAEYIAGGTSYRTLAKKYKVSVTTLTRLAIKEKWVELRQQAESKAEAEMVKKVSSAKSKTNIKINEVADKLIAKMNETIEMIDVIDGQTLKHFTSALKDLKDITGHKSDLDTKEQEARIAKLVKEAEKEEKDTEIKVSIEGDLDIYSK